VKKCMTLRVKSWWLHQPARMSEDDSSDRKNSRATPVQKACSSVRSLNAALALKRNHKPEKKPINRRRLILE